MANVPKQFITEPGKFLYLFPDGRRHDVSLADWDDDAAEATEQAAPNLGRYDVTLDDTYRYWLLFEGEDQPTDWDQWVDVVDLEDELDDDRLSSILSILSGGQITSQSPVSLSGTLTGPIVIDDDYLAANDRAFVWNVNPLNMTFATATAEFGGQDDAGNTWLSVGTMTEVTVDGDPKWRLSFDLEQDDTESLVVGKARYSVAVYASTGERVTVSRGSVQVVRAYTT